jgi:predicted dehydrogenase
LVDVILPIGSGNLNLAVGLVGHGRWGQRHLATLVQLKNEGHISELYVCDIDPGQLDALPEAVDDTFTSLTVMLEETNIGVLGIATPPDTHLVLAKQACEKGVHFLVEKPLGIDYDETAIFLDALPPTITMVVGYLLRHHPGIMAMQEHLSADKEKAFTKFHYKRRTQRPRPHGATPIDTLAIHALDLCALLLDLPLAEFTLSGLTTSVDSAYIELDGEDSQQGIIDVAWGAQEEVRQLTLSGATDEMELDFGTHDLIHRQFGIQHAVAIDLANEQPLYQEWRFILASVSDKSGLLYPSREELLDQARWLANHR